MDASEFDAVRWSGIYHLYLYFGTEKQTITKTKQNRTIKVKFQSEFQFARLNSGTELTHL